MLENNLVRAGAFFAVACGVPILLGLLTDDVVGGIRIGVVMGIVFGVASQYFEPASGRAG